jgi:hypothetical protein
MGTLLFPLLKLIIEDWILSNKLIRLSPFSPHPNPKITIRTLVDGAVIKEQLPGTEFLPLAYFLPWAAARAGTDITFST